MNAFKLVKKVSSRLWKVCHELFNERYHLWKPNNTIKLSSEDLRFIDLNSRYWKTLATSNKKKELILVEGFFASSGHNYLLRTGMLAKAIQEKSNYNIAVLFAGSSYQLKVEKAKYQSFKINDFIYIKPGIRAGYNYFKAFFLAIKYYFSIRTPEDLVKVTHNGISVGDLIYDDILKSEVGCYTISTISSLILRRLIQAFYFYNAYCDIFEKYTIRYLVATHIVYAQYGLLARVALRYSASVIESNDLMVNYLDAEKYVDKLISPNFHSTLKFKIKSYLQDVADKSTLIEYAESDLRSRTTGEVEQFDARFAYRNKVKLSKTEFLKKLNLTQDNNLPVVVIFAHVFSDAPHSSDSLLFLDYFDWLNKTLQFVKTIPNVNWLVKPHPSSKVYKEDGVVESLIYQASIQSENKNIYLYPEGVSSANLGDIADVIVTVQGTAGLEFSCLGLPVIVAGKPYYAGEGFTYDPDSQEEYYKLLCSTANIPRLRPEQIERAKEFYAASALMMSTNSRIIDTKVLDAIWGYGENNQPDINLGNKIINDFLEIHDPKSEIQYSRIQEYMV